MQAEACGNTQGREKEVSVRAVRVERIALPHRYFSVSGFYLLQSVKKDEYSEPRRDTAHHLTQGM